MLRDSIEPSWEQAFDMQLRSPEPYPLYLATPGGIIPSQSSQDWVRLLEIICSAKLLEFFKLANSKLFTLPCVSFSAETQ